MSRASDRILASRDRVLALWEERVREEIPNAAREDHAIILNTLPPLIRQLAEALSPDHPRRLATEGSTVAEEHGGERVRMTHFSLEGLGTTFTIDVPMRPPERKA